MEYCTFRDFVSGHNNKPSPLLGIFFCLLALPGAVLSQRCKSVVWCQASRFTPRNARPKTVDPTDFRNRDRTQAPSGCWYTHATQRIVPAVLLTLSVRAAVGNLQKLENRVPDSPGNSRSVEACLFTQE